MKTSGQTHEKTLKHLFFLVIPSGIGQVLFQMGRNRKEVYSNENLLFTVLGGPETYDAVSGNHSRR
jgi:hypothetical protein